LGLLFSYTSSIWADDAYVGGRVNNPGADLWRAVRQGPPPGESRTQVRGIQTGTLIAPQGETWREMRRDYLIPGAGALLAGVLGLVLLVRLVRGPAREAEGAMGGRILRFAEFERIAHWFLAGLFLFLALTGLPLLLGRFTLLPIIGETAFSALASAGKEGHNLFGPLFIVALVLFFILFVGRNLPTRAKRQDKAKNHSPPHNGFFNTGEKMLFWLVVLGGLTLAGSGLVLVFPQFGQGRELMQILLAIHAIAAVGLLAVIVGHIYMAFVLKGNLDAMSSGYVEARWARQHSGLWHDQCERQGLIETSEPAGQGAEK
jgi:formate dehydrogenase subunit gamma